ncbi:hypothetical protein HPB50_007883 [Hyalomma asiaticum]|uniref:Uncharacterized protein n=1 Tax=Hyalomma asiaticum TaxID=266040 RepID=A0ACB7TGR9_HYAAI|nr:hypothetical protein HPB50_007883 [Hyalomma asiaticum]
MANVKVQETPPGLTPPEELDSRAGDRQEKVKEGSDSQKAQSSRDQDSEGPQYEEMDVASTSGSVTKRSCDQAAGEQDQTGDPTSEEPPPKAVVTRRPTFRPKPNIPPDRKPAPYGEVTDVNRERWRVSGVSEKGSTTRVLSLKLKAGVTIEDVPHQVRVAGELALVVIPGKAPLCLRCQRKGHIRRDCRIPQCQWCRRFGHDETQCVPTYANITGPTTNKTASENFMDEVEAEEAAATAPEKPKKPETPPSATEKRVSTTSHQKNSEEAPEESKGEALQGNATENCVVEAAAPCDLSKNGCEAMEGIVSMSAKRGHGDTVNDSDLPKDTSGGPPPPKSALTRQMSFKPKPNIPPDGRPEAKPPN